MYYKLHRLEEGELLLQNALARFGPDPDFFMTLGTLYSEMFRYEDARQGYLEAITGAETVRDRLFLAVAHYNLSILETRFYQFNLAFDETNASLAAQNRASGRLARGELFLRRLEFKRVFEEYQVAYELDTSPLSKVNLSQSYQIAGRLNEARLYAEDCLRGSERGSDLSWMLNYGIDPVRYKRDLHEILYKTYKGLSKAESFNKGAGIREYIDHLFRMLSYRFKTEVHTQLFRKYSLLSANAYDSSDAPAADTSGKAPNPDALLQYVDAFEAYPARALSYLRKARSLELPIIPEAEPSYTFEEGRLTRSRRLLTETLAGFDPTWERDMLADAYTELALITNGDTRRDAAERLFALNRGALRQAGISLSIALDIVTSGDASIGRKLSAALKAVGLTPAPVEWPSRFRLSIRVSGLEAACELYDGGRGISVLRRNFALNSLSNKELADFAQRLGDMVFTPE
jgi:tetratricopeptide (TPR) repeat protein